MGKQVRTRRPEDVRMIPDSSTGTMAAALVATAALALSPTKAEEAAPTPYDAASQRATADDMRIMAPYIGEFRSATHTFDDGKTEHYFIVKYEWFDRPRTIVRFTISMVIPSQGRTLVNSEGFYGFDPFHQQLYVFGAFTHGMSGWGSICEFSHETGARIVCAKSKGADGVVTYVRDAFEVIDDNTWKNKTRIREGEGGEWKLAHEGTYTRVVK